jgi:membrane-bound serine protease (ClpP class)
MLKKGFISLMLATGLLLCAVPCPADRDTVSNRLVMAIKIQGVINPVAAEFISKSIKKANEQDMEMVVIELDTPGGLMESMRDIIKDIIGSRVPVTVYVSPGGARAASAGAFITLAAHIAVMSPQTNIGAAHPVNVGGSMDETMPDKVTNDAAAYIRSLAEKRGRNADWAEEAVRKSISATEEEALKKNVIDLISANINSLLEELDGREVETAGGIKTLHTSGARITREEMGVRHKILDLISNPNIAYILMLLGLYGLLFEVTNPGAIFPGVVGGICLILAFFAFQTLPINYAGLLLILLAAVLFFLETQITPHGALAIGGIVAMVIGSLMLFETADPLFRVSLSVIITSVATTAVFFFVIVGLIFKAHKTRPVTGQEGLINMEGTATADINENEGTVSVHGEIWSAFSEEYIAKGDKVTVISVSGLKLRVGRKDSGKEA